VHRSNRVRAALPALAIVVLASSACSLSDDGARVIGGVIRGSAPVVRELPRVADDPTLYRQAAVYLQSVDQSVLQRAYDLASSDEVEFIVQASCNISGLASAEPDEVIAALEGVVNQAAQDDDLDLLRNDAQITVDSVDDSLGSVVMTSSGQLAVAIFQEIYC
jgi:hypothetical protein